MMYALLVVMVATFNLALGYFAAVRLGGTSIIERSAVRDHVSFDRKGNDMFRPMPTKSTSNA